MLILTRACVLDGCPRSSRIFAISELLERRHKGCFDAEENIPKYSAVIKLARLMVVQ